MRYKIDVRAAQGTVDNVESELDPVDRADIRLASDIDSGVAALNASRVVTAFSTFAQTLAIPDARAVVAGGWNAVGRTSESLSIYQEADGKMAADVPEPFATELRCNR